MQVDLISITLKRNLASSSQTPSWWQVTLTIQPEQDESIALALESLGAIAITYRDAEDAPIFEPELNTTPLWKNTLITGLFATVTSSPQDLEKNLRTQLSLPDTTAIEVTELPDQEWTRTWMQYFQPTQFGDNLWIIPEGYETPQADANNLYLDPGLAFGTGTHPTTAMCLNWLDAHPPEKLKVLDYGCGSGILAVAAAILGASKIDAVDIDPQAIDATYANADKNHCRDKIHACLPDKFTPDRYDLVLANILAGPLVELAPTLADFCQPNTTLILSGILIEQADELKSAYQPWFEIQQMTQKEEWICLQCRRN